MNAELTTHPSPEALTAFGLGKLSEADASAVAGHLEACPACRQVVENLPADSFVGLVRSARHPATQPPGTPPPAQPMPGALAGLLAAPAGAPLELPPELAGHAKFRIVRELGQGGMGHVYLAEHRLMEKPVAIKVINQALLEHPDALERFQREVKAAAKLDHPHIVRAHDAEQAGSLHMLVMEYVEGLSLAQVVERKGSLPVPHACHYARQAALGLQHAFEQGMVHRDIKPQNLMLTPKGQVKILDFGLARMRERKQERGLTQVDSFMGTPEYVAPEQALNAREADIRADLYSLGCTLYCLLAGRPPFQGETAMQVVLAQMEKEAPPLRELRPDVPAELATVVARMMAKDPAQRYQEPKEVAQALAPFCKSGQKPGPVASPPVPPGPAAAAKRTLGATDTSHLPAPQKAESLKAPTKEVAADVPPADVAASPWQDLSADAAVPKKEKRRTPPTPAAGGKRWRMLGVAGVAIAVLALAIWLLAGVVFKVKTPSGTVVLEMELDPPDAEVFVDGSKIEVRKRGDKEPVTIEVPPGRRELKVSKAGFETTSREITLEPGKPGQVKIKLVDPESRDRWLLLVSAKNEWHYEGKELVGSQILVFGDPQWKDYDFTAEVKRERGIQGGIGLVFRASDVEKAYHYTVGRLKNTVHSVGVLREKPLESKTDVSLISKKDWYSLRVQVRGPSIKCYIDGTMLFDTRDNQFPQGGVGVQTNAIATARFRNLKVTAPDGTVLFDGLLDLSKAKPQAKAPEPDKPDEPKPTEKEASWVSLFNGKDLTGWKPFLDPKSNTAPDKLWTAKDGGLFCGGNVNGYLATEKAYANYVLRLEWRWGDRVTQKRNSGVFVHVTGPDKLWPRCVETQLQADRAGDLWLVGGFQLTTDPSRQDAQVPQCRRRLKDGVENPVGEWNRGEIICQGNTIKVVINGQLVNEGTGAEVTQGRIALQSEGAEIHFRNIEIKELPPGQP